MWPFQTSSNWIRFQKYNWLWDARMTKRQIAIIFDRIIHEYLNAEKQFDSRIRPQIVRPRFTTTLQKLKNNIQYDSKLLKF